MSGGSAETGELLARWNAGDRAALDALLARHLPWILGRVRNRLGTFLRARADSGDFVQETLLDFLAYSPGFEVESGAQFRAVLLRVIENAIRDQDDYHRAWRRRASAEERLPSGTVVDLRSAKGRATRPDEAAERDEEAARLRLALELLEASDRRVLVLRTFEERPYEEIAEATGATVEAVRKRHQRALKRLAAAVESLRRGELP